MYMNSSIVVGSTTQLEGGRAGWGSQPEQMTRKESSINVQTDSGLGREEDRTWPEPELKDPDPPIYQNLKTMTEYARPDATTTTTAQAQTGQYTQPNKTGPSNPQLEESDWGTVVHHNQHTHGTVPATR